MRSFWKTTLIVSFLVTVPGIVSLPAQADGHGGHGHHGGWHGYGPSYSLGFGFAPGYGYGPGYGFGWGLGYGYSSHGSSIGLSFSAPLYFGPRYYPQPAPVMVAPRAYVAAQPATSTCRQVREYQTEIDIGGQMRPAYGNACLQADGSWKIISGPTLAE